MRLKLPLPLAGITALVLVGGCALGPLSDQPRGTSTSDQHVTVGRMTVGSEGAAAIDGLTASPTELGAEERSSLEGLGDMPIAVGQPTEVELRGDLPAEGIRITMRYEPALPEDTAATLAYFDPDFGHWVAVPSHIAPDRSSVSAVVHHLSLWTDFVSGTQQAMQTLGEAATQTTDWAYWAVGKTFDTRVDPPECTDQTPSWLDAATYIETQRNNPVLFCVGADPDKPKILEIKARVNRGFGFEAEVMGNAEWTYNSAFDTQDLEDIWGVLSNIDQALADSLRDLLGDGRMVPPGQEYAFGLSEDAARSLRDNLAFRMMPQDPLPFLVTTLAQLVGVDLKTRADGFVAAAMMVAGCSRDISVVSDAPSLLKAATSCLSGLDERVAFQLSEYLARRGVERPGAVAGRIVGRASIYLALMGPVFNGMNYWAELHVSDAAHTVSVFPKVSAKGSDGGVVLAPNALAGFTLGTPADQVEEVLRAELGDPSEIRDLTACPPVSEPGIGWWRTVSWGDFWVEYLDLEGDVGRSANLRLSRWSLVPDGQYPESVRLDSEIPGSTSFASLKARFPAVELIDGFPLGHYTDLGNGVSYLWKDGRGSAVAVISSGEPRLCWDA